MLEFPGSNKFELIDEGVRQLYRPLNFVVLSGKTGEIIKQILVEEQHDPRANRCPFILLELRVTECGFKAKKEAPNPKNV